jgi:hypothetical protein
MTTPIPNFYKECEDGAIALLQTLTTDFIKKWQVSNNNDAILLGGDKFAIFTLGEFDFTPEDKEEGKTTEYADWILYFDLILRYGEADTAKTTFNALRNAVIYSFKTNQTLKNTPGVEKVKIGTKGPLMQLPGNVTKPDFIYQTMRLEIHQLVYFLGSDV